MEPQKEAIYRQIGGSDRIEITGPINIPAPEIKFPDFPKFPRVEVETIAEQIKRLADKDFVVNVAPAALHLDAPTITIENEELVKALREIQDDLKVFNSKELRVTIPQEAIVVNIATPEVFTTRFLLLLAGLQLVCAVFLLLVYWRLK